MLWIPLKKPHNSLCCSAYAKRRRNYKKSLNDTTSNGGIQVHFIGVWKGTLLVSHLRSRMDMTGSKYLLLINHAILRKKQLLTPYILLSLHETHLEFTRIRFISYYGRLLELGRESRNSIEMTNFCDIKIWRDVHIWKCVVKMHTEKRAKCPSRAVCVTSPNLQKNERQYIFDWLVMCATAEPAVVVFTSHKNLPIFFCRRAF